MLNPTKEIAHAILLVGDTYVLQLRDDMPGIAARGKYSLFGGALEAGETPEAGLRREITEELEIQLGAARLFWMVDRHSEFWQQVVRYWFFVADVTAVWPSHVVREGQAAGLFRYEELPGDAVAPLIGEVLVRHHTLETGT